jgi:DNA-binding NtrC family response regulator
MTQAFSKTKLVKETEMKRIRERGRILIVDDEERISSLLAKRFVMENYSCIIANTSKEALHHFYKNQFSLVICDVKMPQMDGLELLRKMKAFDPDMMMIMMTGYPDIDIVIKAMRMGAHDFLVKPFDLESMVSSVRTILEEKGLQQKVDLAINT